MPRHFRISEAAQRDITTILDRSFEGFGVDAQGRYSALIAAAIRHAATSPDRTGFVLQEECDDRVMTWHLRLSAARALGRRVKRPRHVLVCRRVDEVLVVGRYLDQTMDPSLHINPESDWE